MTSFVSRSTQEEIMDDLNCSGEVVHQTLRELDVINRWLGGNSITLDGIHELLARSKPLQGGPVHIADLGCGSGAMLKTMADYFRANNREAIITGLDANSNIIEFARKHCSGYPEIQLKKENVLDPAFLNQSYDIITATLFLHHFSTEPLIQFLNRLLQQVRVGIIINDLHRDPVAYYAIKLLTRLFSRSAMVRYDAPLSVLRGFSREEWEAILEKAGISNYRLEWKWAFRWQVLIWR